MTVLAVDSVQGLSNANVPTVTPSLGTPGYRTSTAKNVYSWLVLLEFLNKAVKPTGCCKNVLLPFVMFSKVHKDHCLRKQKQKSFIRIIFFS